VAADETGRPVSLPTWPEIKGGALGHLDAAGSEISGVADWLRAIDSPLTPAEARAAREALRLANRARDLIDEAKGVLHA
jgi:hypothetical protein